MTHLEGSNPTGRLEAFSDAVFAIIITIMVLGLRPPTGKTFADLVDLWPLFLSYLLSFIYLIIYWNNHHHLLKTVEFPHGWIMWANAHLLFWLSLVPFATGWLGESSGARVPTAIYGVLLLMSAIAYTLLQLAINKTHGDDSHIKRALGRDLKGKISPLLYIIAIGFAFVLPLISDLLYATVALIWIIPDRRIVGELKTSHHK